MRESASILKKTDKRIMNPATTESLWHVTVLSNFSRGRFLPVGADREVASDFQLIAGTNCDLAGDVRAGDFREDLLARINL
jgi:transcriptional regulatory protein RtcR